MKCHAPNIYTKPGHVAFAHLVGNYLFHTSNYVMLVYDHMLTFGDEVEQIWAQPLTLPTLLFYINRYLTHFQYIIIQVAFHETTWSRSMCNRYVPFAGAATSALVAVAELIMILRVYALYLRNKRILAFLLLCLAGQVAVSAFAVHNGMRVSQPDGFPGCVLTGKNTSFAALWGAPLVTDTFIFAFTAWKTALYMRAHGRMKIAELLLRDGILYFVVIFSVNLMNCLIYFLAQGDLKAVGASFSQIMTSIMVSRLQLNLRHATNSSNKAPYPSTDLRFSSSGGHAASGSILLTSVAHSDPRSTFFTFGNLGGELSLSTVTEDDGV